MSVLKNFKNIPRSPYGGRQGSNVIFFSSILQRSPWRKKKRGPVAPPTGDRPLSPTPGATGPCRPLGGRQGPQCKLEQLLLFFSFFENSLQWCLFFICSSLFVRLLCNFWYLKELCISCSLLTMMALHRIFTISMFERCNYEITHFDGDL